MKMTCASPESAISVSHAHITRFGGLKPSKKMEITMASIANKEILNHDFLRGMYDDGYFPEFLVDMIKDILLTLCQQIEEMRPKSEDEMLLLTHAAVERINDLGEEFEANDSELETVAREAMGADFEFIVRTYGFLDVDIEDVIAPREW